MKNELNGCYRMKNKTNETKKSTDQLLKKASKQDGLPN
jgi:hypothetical protein